MMVRLYAWSKQECTTLNSEKEIIRFLHWAPCSQDFWPSAPWLPRVQVAKQPAPLLLQFSCITISALMSWLPGQLYGQDTMTLLPLLTIYTPVFFLSQAAAAAAVVVCSVTSQPPPKNKSINLSIKKRGGLNMGQTGSDNKDACL